MTALVRPGARRGRRAGGPRLVQRAVRLHGRRADLRDAPSGCSLRSSSSGPTARSSSIGTDDSWTASATPFLARRDLRRRDLRRPAPARAGDAGAGVGGRRRSIRRCCSRPRCHPCAAPRSSRPFRWRRRPSSTSARTWWAGCASPSAARPAGTEVVLRHAEVLDNDGRLFTAPLRTAKATDTYIARGDADGDVRAPVHLPRLPLRRDHRCRPVAGRRRRRGACTPTSSAPARSRARDPLARATARERGVGHARATSVVGADRLPAARRATRLDR